MRSSNNSLSVGLSLANLTVSACCLSVSAFQAGIWILDVVPNQLQAIVMVAGVISILLGSQVIARMTGQAMVAKLPRWVAFVGVLCIVAIEVLSVSTSTTAFSSNMLDSRETQNKQSAEYNFAIQDVKNYQRQIDALTSQLEKLPANYVTKRQEVTREIKQLQADKMRVQNDARNIDVSISGAAFDGLESSTGLSSGDVAFIFALLLSIVPLVGNVMGGAFGWSVRPVVKSQPVPQEPSVKKPQARRRLRAV